MVNNSTNINNANNQFSIEHKKTITHGVGNQDTSLGQVQQCGRVKWSMASKLSPFDNWISTDADINKLLKKKCAESLGIKKAIHVH